MSIESVIYTALTTALGAIKVFPTYPDQDAAYPFVVYDGIQSEPIMNLQGAIKMTIEHFDVTFVGLDWGVLYGLADTVKSALHNQAGGSQRILWTNRTTKDNTLIHTFRII